MQKQIFTVVLYLFKKPRITAHFVVYPFSSSWQQECYNQEQEEVVSWWRWGHFCPRFLASCWCWGDLSVLLANCQKMTVKYSRVIPQPYRKTSCTWSRLWPCTSRPRCHTQWCWWRGRSNPARSSRAWPKKFPTKKKESQENNCIFMSQEWWQTFQFMKVQNIYLIARIQSHVYVTRMRTQCLYLTKIKESQENNCIFMSQEWWQTR